MILTLSLLTACFEKEGGTRAALANLTDQGGCGDVFLYARAPDNGEGLWVRIGGDLVAGAYAEGQRSLDRSYTLPDDAVDLRYELGAGVASRYCNDVVEPYEIEEAWRPVGGTVSLTLVLTGDEPQAWDMPAEASLLLEAVELRGESSGEAFEIDEMSIEARVGWLPG